jgi:hypothetical protein
MGPGTDPLGVVNTGHAAHIHAAAPGGPRYDPRMSTEERRSISNGVWLCATCATLIDKDIAAHPASLLRRWRQEAEDRARRSHGEKPPRPSDATETLVTALTGRATQFVPDAIRNTHLATKVVLEKLDSRFEVTTSHAKGVTTIRIDAKEPVAFQMLVAQEHAAAWEQGFESLIRSAKRVELPMHGVSVTGSPLLEAIAERAINKEAKLEISPIGKRAVLKLRSQGSSEVSNDVHGNVFGGLDAIRFEGLLYDGLVEIQVAVKRHGDGAVNPQLDVAFLLSAWQGLHLLEVPYFNNLVHLLGALGGRGDLRAELEVRGKVVLGVRNPKLHDSQLEMVETLVQYTRRARVVAAFCDAQVLINLNHPFTAEDHRLLADAADIIEGQWEYGPEAFTSPPEVTVDITDPAAYAAVADATGAHSWKIQQLPQTISVFGTQVVLPPLEIYFSGARIHLEKKAAPSNEPEQQVVVLRFEPTPEFRCVFAYQQPL